MAKTLRYLNDYNNRKNCGMRMGSGGNLIVKYLNISFCNLYINPILNMFKEFILKINITKFHFIKSFHISDLCT